MSSLKVLPLSVTNKVIKSLDMYDKPERFLLHNQLIQQINLLNDNNVEDGVQFTSPYNYHFTYEKDDLSQSLKSEHSLSSMSQ